MRSASSLSREEFLEQEGLEAGWVWGGGVKLLGHFDKLDDGFEGQESILFEWGRGLRLRNHPRHKLRKVAVQKLIGFKHEDIDIIHQFEIQFGTLFLYAKLTPHQNLTILSLTPSPLSSPSQQAWALPKSWVKDHLNNTTLTITHHFNRESHLISFEGWLHAFVCLSFPSSVCYNLLFIGSSFFFAHKLVHLSFLQTILLLV